MSRVREAIARAGSPNQDAESLPPAAGEGVPLFPVDEHEAGPQWETEPAAAGSTGPDPAGEARHQTHAQTVMAEEPVNHADDGPVLGDPVPQLGEKVVLSPNADHAMVEQYRRLAGRLHLAQAEHGIKVVMVASALPGEGKTLTATNLAVTLSESYQRDVLLIDGDLRRPSIHDMFRIPNLSGLNDGVRSETDRRVPLVRWSDHLTIITAGRPDADPMKVLVSQRMKKVIAEGASRFQWVIIDTPPVGLLTDASLFSAMVDTAIFVIEAGRTPYAEIQRSVEAIGRDRVFGVVLNRAKSGTQGGYGGYRYQYTSMPAPK